MKNIKVIVLLFLIFVSISIYASGIPPIKKADKILEGNVYIYKPCDICAYRLYRIINEKLYEFYGDKFWINTPHIKYEGDKVYNNEKSDITNKFFEFDDGGDYLINLQYATSFLAKVRDKIYYFDYKTERFLECRSCTDNLEFSKVLNAPKIGDKYQPKGNTGEVVEIIRYDGVDVYIESQSGGEKSTTKIKPEKFFNEWERVKTIVTTSKSSETPLETIWSKATGQEGSYYVRQEVIGNNLKITIFKEDGYTVHTYTREGLSEQTYENLPCTSTDNSCTIEITESNIQAPSFASTLTSDAREGIEIKTQQREAQRKAQEQEIQKKKIDALEEVKKGIGPFEKIEDITYDKNLKGKQLQELIKIKETLDKAGITVPEDLDKAINMETSIKDAGLDEKQAELVRQELIKMNFPSAAAATTKPLEPYVKNIGGIWFAIFPDRNPIKANDESDANRIINFYTKILPNLPPDIKNKFDVNSILSQIEGGYQLIGKDGQTLTFKNNEFTYKVLAIINKKTGDNSYVPVQVETEVKRYDPKGNIIEEITRTYNPNYNPDVLMETHKLTENNRYIEEHMDVSFKLGKNIDQMQRILKSRTETIYATDKDGNILKNKKDAPIISNIIRTKLEQDKSGKLFYEIYDEGTGKLLVGLDTDKDGVIDAKIDAKTGEILDKGLFIAVGWTQEEIIDRAKRSQRRQNIRDLFAAFKHTGLRGYSRFLFSEEELSKWRESVDKFFATFMLGTEYWESKVCQQFIDVAPEDGVAYVETPGGLLEMQAHIEAERSLLSFANQTGRNTTMQKEFFYKISYIVKNPQRFRTSIKFNIYIYGDRTVKLYNQSVEVKEGGSVGRFGENMIIKYSKYNYNKVCIVFDESVRVAGDNIKELCNNIAESTAPITGYEAAGEEATSQEQANQEVDF